ncbi:MAG: hypothetical protein WAX14_02005 [Rhodococcus sp. (in: high G+C Gram-positive bacteria)]|uniref:hypothetical protein n=1 Tax=Rhodococcus sp. TaxID=1831 RepID=UPI003BB682FE
MSKTPAPFLAAAIESLVKIQGTRPGSVEEFVSNSLLWDGTLMRVQVAGEYLSKVRTQFPDFYERHHDDSWIKLIAIPIRQHLLPSNAAIVQQMQCTA